MAHGRAVWQQRSTHARDAAQRRPCESGALVPETRAGGANEANTWEQSPQEWLIDYLLKPLYYRGTRHWLVKWVGFKRATAVDATELARDLRARLCGPT